MTSPSALAAAHEAPRSAIVEYFEHMGPTCDHHRDECPDDCPKIAQRAEAEYRALRQSLLDSEREGARMRDALKAARQFMDSHGHRGGARDGCPDCDTVDRIDAALCADRTGKQA